MLHLSCTCNFITGSWSTSLSLRRLALALVFAMRNRRNDWISVGIVLDKRPIIIENVPIREEPNGSRIKQFGDSRI